MKNLQESFNKVKEINWNEAVVSFYVVKRRLAHREAKYEILQVNVDEKLRKKLRKVASDKVQKSNQTLEYTASFQFISFTLLKLSCKFFILDLWVCKCR
jgi:hypothetical protein